LARVRWRRRRAEDVRGEDEVETTNGRGKQIAR